MPNKSIRRSVSMTPKMADQLDLDEYTLREMARLQTPTARAQTLCDITL